MTILWCGGEDIDFPNGVTVESNYMRPEYARVSLYKNAIFTSVPFTGGEITSGWISAQCRTSNSYAISAYDSVLFGITDSIGKGLWTKKAIGKLQLRTYDGTTWVTLAESTSILFDTGNIDKIDIQLTSYGAASNVKVYHNGTLVIDYTGDTTISGVTGFAHVSGYGKFSYGNMSEFIVADEDTRNMSLKTHAPNAAGDINEWTGAYTDIDETTLSDADTIQATADSQDFQCNLTGMPAGSFICKGVKVSARNLDGSSLGAKIGIKTNSTVDVGAVINTGGVWANSERLYQVNPVTGVAFTPAELEALQLAFESAPL